MLRVAGALKAAKISTPKIAAALEQIRSALPVGSTAGDRVGGIRQDLAVREGAREWEASGQYALPLIPRPAPAQVADLRPTPEVSAASLAHEHFQRGHMLEDSDVVAARAAYLAALSVSGRSPRGENQPGSFAASGWTAQGSGAVVPPGKNVERASVIQPRHPARRSRAGRGSGRGVPRCARAGSAAARCAFQSIKIAREGRVGRVRRCGTCLPIGDISRATASSGAC